MRLGKHQLALLANMGSPTTLLIVDDKIARSLQSRGLIAAYSEKTGGFMGITPAGLRALADHMAAGALADLYDHKFKANHVRLYFKADRKG